MAGQVEKVFATVTKEAYEAFASDRLLGVFNSSGEVAKASAGGAVDCVVRYGVAIDEVASCEIDGLPLLAAAGGTIAVGDDLAVDSSAKLVTATKVSQIIVGKALSTGASGGVVAFKPYFKKGQGVKHSNATAAVTADGAIAIPLEDTTYYCTKAGVAAMTIVDPTPGTHDGLILRFIATTANANTLSNAAGSGFNAGGASKDIGTFGGAIGDGITITAYGGKWLVVSSVNVTLG